MGFMYNTPAGVALTRSPSVFLTYCTIFSADISHLVHGHAGRRSVAAQIIHRTLVIPIQYCIGQFPMTLPDSITRQIGESTSERVRLAWRPVFGGRCPSPSSMSPYMVL